MTHNCEAADRKALTEIGEALLHESERCQGEAREGRLRLASNINTKLLRLGAPVATRRAAMSQTTSFELIAREIENEDLCAHTRNFLQMARSRLCRYDALHEAEVPSALMAQIIAGVELQQLPSERSA